MDVKIKLNGKLITDSVDQDMVLLDFAVSTIAFR